VTTTTPTFITTPTSEANKFFWIRLERSGARFVKRAGSYIKFDGFDAYATDNKDEASIVDLRGDVIMHVGLYVGTAIREGAVVLERFWTAEGNTVHGWQRNGDELSFSPARLGFCVTDSLTVIAELTSAPPFVCTPYRLIAENVDGNPRMDSFDMAG
jgi:hypothetical protein